MTLPRRKTIRNHPNCEILDLPERRNFRSQKATGCRLLQLAKNLATVEGACCREHLARRWGETSRQRKRTIRWTVTASRTIVRELAMKSWMSSCSWSAYVFSVAVIAGSASPAMAGAATAADPAAANVGIRPLPPNPVSTTSPAMVLGSLIGFKYGDTGPMNLADRAIHWQTGTQPGDRALLLPVEETGWRLPAISGRVLQLCGNVRRHAAFDMVAGPGR